jgi:hypothetical protein
MFPRYENDRDVKITLGFHPLLSFRTRGVICPLPAVRFWRENGEVCIEGILPIREVQVKQKIKYNTARSETHRHTPHGLDPLALHVKYSDVCMHT